VTRRSIAGVLALLGMLSLAACTSNPVQPVPEEPASSAEPAPEPTTPAEPTPAVPTPAPPVGIPVEQSCDELVTAEELSAVHPDFAADPGYAPSPGSDAEVIATLEGVTCGWIDPATGQTIEIAVAHLVPDDIEALQNRLVLTSHSVPTYGGVDYFEKSGTTGIANVFEGDYWIVADSPTFYEPGDAAPLISAVKAALQ
jgi:hypothetical protein